MGCKAQKLVEGTVISSITDNPVPYANVVVKNQGDLIIGTNTNNSGYFKLEIPSDLDSVILEFSLVGYTTSDTLLIFSNHSKLTGQFILGKTVKGQLIFNEQTAQEDIDNGIVQIYTYGYQPINIDKMNQVAKKYGFQYKVLTCDVDEIVIESVKRYNQFVSTYLFSKNENEWQDKLAKEIEAIKE
jgi:hypothetical protein